VGIASATRSARMMEKICTSEKWIFAVSALV
jgi:hypothetical protein